MTGALADLRAVLNAAGVDPRSVDTAEPVTGNHRNQSWFFRVRNDPRELVLKLQSDISGYPTVRHEADVLASLQQVACVPRLVSAGTGGEPKRPFIITERLTGEPLDTGLGRGIVLGAGQLSGYAQWLLGFSQVRDPWEDLTEKTREFIGPWSIDYFPGADPPDDRTHIGLVHGSFDPKNILVEPGKAHLCGVIDFEATRLGSPLIDVAGLALHFLIRHHADLAWQWLSVAAEVWGWPTLPRQAMPYLVDQYQRRETVGTVPNPPHRLVRELVSRCRGSDGLG